MNTITTQ